jgi:dienelactone hydrolase
MLLASCDSGDVDKTPSVSEHLRPVASGLNKLYFQDGQLFYLYVPEIALQYPADAKILVSVHEYSGRKDDPKGRKRVEEAAYLWADVADEQRWVVLAPQFDEQRFDNDYQRLNLYGKKRADVRLHELIEEVTRLLPGIKTEKILLFGFSGGGQFVHRYALFHPGRIARAVASSAGWYTFPDEQLPYPVGISPESLPADMEPKIHDLLRVNLLILVGGKDTHEGDFVKLFSKGSERYDLMTIQGEGRRERAENWVTSLKHKADDDRFQIRFKMIPNAGHSVNRELKEIAAEFLSRN